MNTLIGTSLAFSVAAMSSASIAQDYQEGLIETKILDMDPQAGIESHHFYYVDFTNQSVTASFNTGSTTINLGVVSFEVSSVRDNFQVENVVF